MGTIEEQVATVIGQLAWINIKFSIQKSSEAEIVRIYGRKEARRGSFLGNEASPTRVAIIFALLYATSAFPSRIHLGPQSSVHYLVFPPLSFSRVSVRAERFVTRATGRPTRETHGTPLSFLPPSPFIVIHAFYGPCYVDRPANPRDTLYSATSVDNLPTELDRSNYTIIIRLDS